MEIRGYGNIINTFHQNFLKAVHIFDLTDSPLFSLVLDILSNILIESYVLCITSEIPSPDRRPV